MKEKEDKGRRKMEDEKRKKEARRLKEDGGRRKMEIYRYNLGH